MGIPNPRRADTPEEKRAVIESLYVAWLCFPELRLGQLIVNAMPRNVDDILYNLEDLSFETLLSEFVQEAVDK